MSIEKTPRLQDGEFALLTALINKKTGLSFNASKRDFLERRLMKRLQMHNLNGFKEYYLFLKYDPDNAKEWNTVYNLITVKETSFFRYKEQFDVFSNCILSQMVKRKLQQNDPIITIWSAGCSTGEEPYTIAMITANVLGKNIQNMKITILASDISSQALDFARAGTYSAYKLRNTPEWYRKQFFKKDGEDYRINDSVKNMVEFKTHNLLDENTGGMPNGVDIVFCRNTLIYFDIDSQKQVINDLYDCLNPSGFLFLGHSESLHSITKSFRVLQFPKAIVYVKE